MSLRLTLCVGPSPTTLSARRPIRVPSLYTITQRYNSDIAVHPRSSQPIVRAGLTGRSSVSGHVVTVFGSTGFLGRYLVNRLGKKGTKVVLPYRCHEDEKRHLKPMGDLGQIVLQDYDVRNYDQIVDAVKYSDAVYNLIGRNYPTKNFNFEAVNVAAARDIARACAETGVPRLVHLSALGAQEGSTSQFLHTKALGEREVREEYPTATIVRPGTLIGFESEILSRIGVFRKFLPVVNHNQQIVRPVDVADVALALDMMMTEADSEAQTYELYGAKPYTHQDIINICSNVFREKVNTVNIPKPIMKAVTGLLQYWIYPQLSPDQVERMFIDQVPSPHKNVKTLADLGIEPRTFELTVLPYIRHFRKPALNELGLDPKKARTFGKHPSY
ncbi:Protein-lysine N-methyltransferase efm5 [Dimargaris cristalligena]|nr:Protein-lysine N-methyltransferase efm5 [Dimargaris cristalligena]